MIGNQGNLARFARKILERCERRREMTKQQKECLVAYVSEVTQKAPDTMGIDEQGEIQQGKPLPDNVHQASPEELAEKLVGWHDAILNAAMWLSLLNVESRAAALLLCKFNPDDNTQDPSTACNEQTGPDDLKQLFRVFEDIALSDTKPRSLKQWHSLAKLKGLKYDSWLSDYEQAMQMLHGIGDSSPMLDDATAIKRTVQPIDDWKHEALRLAQEIGEKKWRIGERNISARNVSEPVSIALAKNPKWHGIRGPRDAGSIRSDALKGWKFTPPCAGMNGMSGTT